MCWSWDGHHHFCRLCVFEAKKHRLRSVCRKKEGLLESDVNAFFCQITRPTSLNTLEMTLPRLYILSTWIIHTTMTKQYNGMNNQFKWDFTNRFSLCFKKYVSAVCLFSCLSDFFYLLPFSHQWKLIPSLASIHLLGLHLVNYKLSITQLI